MMRLVGCEMGRLPMSHDIVRIIDAALAHKKEGQ
jgi:hypothetical protein